MRLIARPGGVVIVSIREASVWGESRGGHSRPSGQHDEASAESSAGRRAFTPSSSARNETSGKSAPVQPEVHATDEVEDQVRGGDRRIARREPRESRVTVRFSEGEAAQLARVAQRYRLAESGAIRAAVDYLDGAPPPRVVDRDVLRLVAAVNAIGVNVNQLTRQGWAGIEPELGDLRDATAQLLALAKEMSE